MFGVCAIHELPSFIVSAFKKPTETTQSLHDRFDLQRDFPQTAGGPRLRDYPEAWAAVLHLTTHRGLHVEVTLSELDGRDILEVFGTYTWAARTDSGCCRMLLHVLQYRTLGKC